MSKYLVCAVLIVLFTGCNTTKLGLKVPKNIQSDTNDENQNGNDSDIQSEDVNTVVQGFLGKRYSEPVFVGNERINLDCIGLILAVYKSMGIDLSVDFNRHPGNGISRLYATLLERSLLHNGRPAVGDIIFWDNTWDRSQDGNPGNNPLTHAGLVLTVEPDGQIYYVHANYVRGVVVEEMNLERPDVYRDQSGKVLNSILYYPATTTNHPENWLSGQLFNKYGRVVRSLF